MLFVGTCELQIGVSIIIKLNLDMWLPHFASVIVALLLSYELEAAPDGCS